MSQVAVIGIGNPLYGDDGFGVRVIEELNKTSLPGGVDVIDGGSLGVGLLEFLKTYPAVILLDAADMGLAPGTLNVFKPEEVRSLERGHSLSLHSTDILAVIELAEVLEEEIGDIHIIAVQPRPVCLGHGLSEEVEKAIPAAITQTRELLDRVLA